MDLQPFIPRFDDSVVQVDPPSTAIGQPRLDIHQVLISPVSFFEIWPLLEEIHTVIKPYQRAWTEYTNQHPIREGEDARLYYKKVENVSRGKCKAEMERFDAIEHRLKTEKQNIFNHLAPIFGDSIMRL